MRISRLVPLVTGLALVAEGPVRAQELHSLPPPASVLFEVRPSGLLPLAAEVRLVTLTGTDSRDRTHRALIGGAIGAATGVVFCTVMSTLVDDSADGGLSFCPLDSYLLIGGGGFVIGAVLGWVL
jgi:hypothetical protein